MKTWHFCVPTCLVLAVLVSATALAQTSPFFVPPVFPGAGATVSADFNRDGKPDLISTDGTVLLGNGDGTFTVGKPLGLTGQNTNLIATGDFNGDGKPDLVLASLASNTFYVLLGNGDGTFGAPIITTIASPLSFLAAADLNGDGKADVLVVPSISGGLFTYLGKGDGTFSTGVAAGATTGGKLGDFNGDGKLDLAVATGIQLGNGNGTFQAVIPFPSGSLGPTVIGDFNGDGKLDFAGGTSGTGSNPDQLQILFGNGDGTFQLGPVQSLPSGTLAGSLAVAADLNNDGKAELIGENFPYIQTFKNNGDGTFTAELIYNLFTQYSPPAVPYILVGDFNHDGNLDVATDNVVLLGNGDATLRGDQAILNIGGAIVAGDFNNDGHQDIAASQQFVTGQAIVHIFLNDGKGNLSLANTYSFVAGNDFSGPALVAAADVNGDGNVDLILTFNSPNSWSVYVMLGNGDGSFQPSSTYPGVGPGEINGFAIADLSGNHKPDILVVAGSFLNAQGYLWVMPNNGDGTFAAPVQYYVGSGTGNLAVGDFNDDGKLDVAVADGEGAPSTPIGIAILLGNGDGTFQPATFNTPLGSTAAANAGVFNVFAADVNGDGNVDLLATTLNAQSSTQLQVLLGNGDGTFTPSTTISNTGGVLQAMDFNGDGKIDLLVASDSGILSLLLGNGDGTFGNPIPLLPGPGSIVVADFNGDNRPDIAVTVPGISSNSQSGLIWLFNTAGPTVPDFVITSSPLKPATLAPGSSASSTITLTSVGGFSASVALSCAGLPSGATCSFAPASLPGGSGTSTLTIATTAASGLFRLTERHLTPKINDHTIPFLFVLSAMSLLLALFVRRQGSAGHRGAPLTLAVLLCAAILLISCGSGNSSGASSGGGAGTQAGNYTVTVSGTFTSGATTITHTTTLTLIVQ
jgi:hypothetical protein